MCLFDWVIRFGFCYCGVVFFVVVWGELYCLFEFCGVVFDDVLKISNGVVVVVDGFGDGVGFSE